MADVGDDGVRPRDVDLALDRAHGARIYDYILGGKDNYELDRAAAHATLQVWPALRIHMQANRAFMHRVARYMARDKGIRQFLDIGTGIPTSPNFHEVVQEIAPESRVVYVDNDPTVLVYARALLNSSPEGKTAYIQADMRAPEKIIAAPELLGTLDLSQPIGLTLIAMVAYIEDDDEAYRVVKRIVDILPPGSWFAASIATSDFDPGPLAKVRDVYHSHGEALKFRDHDQAAKFFEGLELEEPGVVQIHKWHPDPLDVGQVNDADIAMYGGIAYKP